MSQTLELIRSLRGTQRGSGSCRHGPVGDFWPWPPDEKFVLKYKNTVSGSRTKAAALIAVIAAATLASPDPAHAFNSSAWTKQEGELWTLLSLGLISAGDQFRLNGDRGLFIDGLEGETFKDESFYTQFEYGLVDNLTLHLEVPFKRVFVETQAFETGIEGLGSVYAGVRLNMLQLLKIQSRLTWSVEIGAFIPTGYTRNLAPSLGPGNVEFDVKTAVGYGFQITEGLPAYTQVGLGLRARSTAFALSGSVDCPSAVSDPTCVEDVQPNFSDEILYLAEFGLTPFKGSLLLFGKVMGNASLLEPTFGFTPANPIPTRQRLLKVGAGTFVYPLRFFDVPIARNIGLAAQYYSTVWGQNTPATDDLFLGVEYSHFF